MCSEHGMQHSHTQLEVMENELAGKQQEIEELNRELEEMRATYGTEGLQQVSLPWVSCYSLLGLGETRSTAWQGWLDSSCAGGRLCVLKFHSLSCSTYHAPCFFKWHFHCVSFFSVFKIDLKFKTDFASDDNSSLLHGRFLQARNGKVIFLEESPNSSPVSS